MLRILAQKRLFSRVSILKTKRYTPDHEWISVKGNVGVFGITDYAQKALGDVVYIEVPSVGDSVAKKGFTSLVC
jgi:glycine cleavage system H protein